MKAQENKGGDIKIRYGKVKIRGDLENLGRNREKEKKEKRKIIIENMRIERKERDTVS